MSATHERCSDGFETQSNVRRMVFVDCDHRVSQHCTILPPFPSSVFIIFFFIFIVDVVVVVVVVDFLRSAVLVRLRNTRTGPESPFLGLHRVSWRALSRLEDAELGDTEDGARRARGGEDEAPHARAEERRERLGGEEEEHELRTRAHTERERKKSYTTSKRSMIGP